MMVRRETLVSDRSRGACRMENEKGLDSKGMLKHDEVTARCRRLTTTRNSSRLVSLSSPITAVFYEACVHG